MSPEFEEIPDVTAIAIEKMSEADGEQLAIGLLGVIGFSVPALQAMGAATVPPPSPRSSLSLSKGDRACTSVGRALALR